MFHSAKVHTNPGTQTFVKEKPKMVFQQYSIYVHAVCSIRIIVFQVRPEKCNTNRA